MSKESNPNHQSLTVNVEIAGSIEFLQDQRSQGSSLYKTSWNNMEANLSIHTYIRPLFLQISNAFIRTSKSQFCGRSLYDAAFLLKPSVLYLIMMPFSTEKLSVGKPQMFQSRILTGSPNVLVTEKSSEQGMLIWWHCSTHSAACSFKKETNNLSLVCTLQ